MAVIAEVLAEHVNGPTDEFEPRVTADGMTLFFVRGRAGGDADLYSCTRTVDGWSPPEPTSCHEIRWI